MRPLVCFLAFLTGWIGCSFFGWSKQDTYVEANELAFYLYKNPRIRVAEAKKVFSKDWIYLCGSVPANLAHEPVVVGVTVDEGFLDYIQKIYLWDGESRILKMNFDDRLFSFNINASKCYRTDRAKISFDYQNNRTDSRGVSNFKTIVSVLDGDAQ